MGRERGEWRGEWRGREEIKRDGRGDEGRGGREGKVRDKRRWRGRWGRGGMFWKSGKMRGVDEMGEVRRGEESRRRDVMGGEGRGLGREGND